MIVVDSNVLAYLYLPGEFFARAKSLRRQHPEWHAPSLWRSEFRNILAIQMRHGLLTLGDANLIQREAERQMIQGERAVDSAQVLALALQSSCTAYDCEYVALAQTLGCPLFTMDKQVLRAFPGTAQALPEAEAGAA